ncbi:hypothetical protein LSH36_54g09032 [Paralvinella palmiformis]|uniref:RDD domain-containing protein n=1 Tax=Paralvinella palmiformis TaxID=53620 RepID=A0AAD9K5B5_9ANNE|nr:hypothetical protein LSH36_54g09032 [Paralvinella palmiformis]
MHTDHGTPALRFKIPPLWKRVAAEFLDFFLLFITKLVVTIFFVEYVGLVDLHHYDFEYLMTTDMDYNTAFTMTSELVAMEIVNRVFICIFETLCLRKGLGGTVGGTTPGKRILGLKVISCREVSSLLGRKVLVIPAGNIGTWK